MKKCKCCEKSLPKSRISSDYCLDCEDKINEWIRIEKAAKAKILNDAVARGEEMIKEMKQGFKSFLKDGEKMLKDLGKMLDD